MLPYKRTELGLAEIQTRNIRLPARARTLLLLLESVDIHNLNNNINAKIVTQENFDILLQAGLIVKITDYTEQKESPIKQSNFLRQQDMPAVPPVSTEKDNNKVVHVTQSLPANKPRFESLDDEQPNAAHLTAPEPTLEPLNSIDEIKAVMTATLRQYAGLMAKRLIEDIQNSQTITEIRLQQRQWLTLLFETKIPKADLNAKLQQINNSMTALSLSHAV